jgi:hypothetical protein
MEEGTELGYVFIGKEKLAKGLSFPIKRSVLDEFLRREGITKVTGVGFCGTSRQNVVLAADYYGPRRRASHHTLNLWIFAVRSDLRRHAEELVKSTALPRLAEWISSFSDDSLLRAKTDHSTSFALEFSSTDLRLIQCTGRGRKLK